MNDRMIGVIGGTGRVGRECLRYLHENTRLLPARGCL